MALNITITPEAERDLDEIYDYILHHFLAPQAAKNTMNNIRHAIERLLEIPDLGIDVSKRLGKPFSNTHTLRMTIAGNYMVFYIVDDHQIAILRVLYQKRNWIEIFK